MGLINPCGWIIGSGLNLDSGSLNLSVQNYTPTQTYTPVLRNSGAPPTTLTYTSQFGIYHTSGDTITFSAQVVVNTFVIGGGGGDIVFTLPPVAAGAFTVAGLVSVQVEGCAINAACQNITGLISSAASTMFISQNVSNGSAINLPLSALASGSKLSVSGIYFIS
jgi:hypothetical protein